jgi:hypothetical protein
VLLLIPHQFPHTNIKIDLERWSFKGEVLPARGKKKNYGKRAHSALGKKGSKGRLIELGVKNSHEDNNCQTEEGKHAEGQVAEHPEGRSRYDVDVGVKQTDAAGDEKNEGYYH